MSEPVRDDALPAPLVNGTKREIAGKRCVYYDGYWIKLYEPPADTLSAKKSLIESLTRRLFNHVEHGINIPGRRLEEAQSAYERETDPERRRVNKAMLAGAYFNRAADIFTKLVELQELGVAIDQSNELMRHCGRCLMQALELGKAVQHRSGDEAIDELWGEPFKAFSIPVEQFYESRYLKIAQTMGNIDRIADALVGTFAAVTLFEGVDARIRAFAEAAKLKCETLRTDPVIFDVWPSFVVAGERLSAFADACVAAQSTEQIQLAADGKQLVQDGKALVTFVTRARVPMPKSTGDFLDRCAHFGASWGTPG
jgi:hypothetical protein